MGERFIKESVLDRATHLNTIDTIEYTFFTTCHPLGVKKGFLKSEALRLLRTNSSKGTFEDNIEEFRSHLLERGYPIYFIKKTLSAVKFEGRTQALLKQNTHFGPEMHLIR